MQSAPAQEILADPYWLAHRYDETAEAFRFIRLDREGHRELTFITDEHLQGNEQTVTVPVSAMDRTAIPSAPLHFVFHSAYCCSTLVARMFDAPGKSMGLKEPVLLNDIVGWRRRGGPPRKIANVLDLSLALLARPFASGESVVVKPSNIVNSLAPAMLGLRGDAKALLLYAPIEDFLASIAVKGLWGRRWVRQAFLGQLHDGVVVEKFTPNEMFELTDLQVAGLGWLSHHGIYAQMLERFGSDRIRICDSRTLLDDREKTVEAAFSHFGIALAEKERRGIAEGPAFSTNSKDRSDYSAQDRQSQINATRAANHDEIEKVATWVRTVAQGLDLNPEPPPTLIF